MLVTSGRDTTELAAKAAMLGISMIASRTSPTNMAVKMCEEAGIVLIGYVRGVRFTIYTCPERIACEERTELPVSDRRIKRITGVVLTDGASTSLQQGHDQLATLPLLLEAGWLEKRVLPLPGRNGIIGYRE
jgi:FdhD protein